MIEFKWIDNEDPIKLAEFFKNNVNQKYISHGEIIDGRAITFTEWKDDLVKVMTNEFKDILDNSNEETYSQICVCNIDKKLIGLCLIQFKNNTKVAILEDIIIDNEFRKNNIGSMFLKWIEEEIILKEMSFIILESGINNKGAHDFFSKNGYEQSSIVMIKKLKN